LARAAYKAAVAYVKERKSFGQPIGSFQMIQAKIADMKCRAAEIQSLGYRAVLVAPPLKSEGPAWWARYQPQDYRTIDHPLGNRE
ncbi:acyl-CoA dehydrogenase family protein, partial [Vogesella mureinivorans]|uniref:acyl-CoA dehydrogenase family protein n=1 Tax=Vogesella mureinivorans TaxID=657276 RepID=UPI0023EF4DD2